MSLPVTSLDCSESKTLNVTLNRKNYPIICMLPHCYRIMLKQNLRKHCISLHNFTLEDDLPEY